MATIIVGAYMVRYPLGGMMSWVFQHLVGFKALGHEVYFVEKYVYDNSCYNPVNRTMSNDCSYGAKMTADLLATAGLQDNWCFVDHDGNYYGMSRKKIEAVFQIADCYIDLGTQNGWEQESSSCPRRVLIDGEPGFSQIHHSNNEELEQRYSRYNYFFTNGYNIGRNGNTIPIGNVHWKHMYSPVHADMFKVSTPAKDAPFSTVMNWQSHKPITYNGNQYGQKDIEFEKFIQLPTLVNSPMEVAVSGKNIPATLLANFKWNVVNGTATTKSYESFCNYVEKSKAEFSVCKNVFVALNTGWFSDKSAVFLACGRPVVLEDTGFSEHLPCGLGLIAVKNVDEASTAITEIENNWDKHSKAAREIAMECLNTRVILKRFMNEIND
ncbi:MAG TPA: hypothetical protein VJU78_03730 [Chitinophagaceae bacterium]|nr:hypothetical protein [Chitinophagaceae bacterium]